MNKGYKIFSAFLGLLLLIGMSAKANKTDGVKSSTEDSVKVKPSRIYNFRLYFQKYYFVNTPSTYRGGGFLVNTPTGASLPKLKRSFQPQ